MNIGVNTTKEDINRLRGKNLYELRPEEFRQVVNDAGEWNPKWNNQQFTNKGEIAIPEIGNKYGNALLENSDNPDKVIPSELFKFDLILNNRRFNVILDTLLRINTDEDLAEYPESRLIYCLEQCASYRATCYSAYIAAHRVHRQWEQTFNEWLVEKRKEARDAIKMDRILDKNSGLRKEIGQITAEEVLDWVILKYGGEHRRYTDLVEEWKEYEKIYLELRDTLVDRAIHLQTILKRVSDGGASKVGNVQQIP